MAYIKEHFKDEPKIKWALIDEARQEFGISRDGSSGGGVKEFKTDPAAFKEIEGMCAHGTILQKYPSYSSFFDAYKDKLSPSLMKEYRNQIYKKSGADDMDETIQLSIKELVKDRLPKTIKDDPEKYTQFIRKFNHEISLQIKAHGPLSIVDQVKVAGDLLNDEVVNKGSFSEWANEGGNFFDVSVPKWQIPDGARKGNDGQYYIKDENGFWRPWTGR